MTFSFSDFVDVIDVRRRATPYHPARKEGSRGNREPTRQQKDPRAIRVIGVRYLFEVFIRCKTQF
jgi:hypothetical protein